MPTYVSFSVSVMQVSGRRKLILVWDEEKEEFNTDEETNSYHGSIATSNLCSTAEGCTGKMEDLGK